MVRVRLHYTDTVIGSMIHSNTIQRNQVRVQIPANRPTKALRPEVIMSEMSQIQTFPSE